MLTCAVESGTISRDSGSEKWANITKGASLSGSLARSRILRVEGCEVASTCFMRTRHFEWYHLRQWRLGQKCILSGGSPGLH